MSINNTLTVILNHPLNKKTKIKSLIKYLKWQINTLINPYPIIFPFGEKSRFITWKGLTGSIFNYYCGLQDFEDMSFLLHFLRDSDLFVDIGANVGSYTLLAASERNAETISIEPVPNTFSILKDNITINSLHPIVSLHNIGLGKEKGTIKFTKSLDTMNHVALALEADTITVPIDKFDNITKLEKITLIKIDVEGFETEVIEGMTTSLLNNNLKAIIIELNGSATRYGYDENLIHEKLLSYGFCPYSYLPFKRNLIKIKDFGTQNTIYIRDIEFVQNRIRLANIFKVNGYEI